MKHLSTPPPSASHLRPCVFVVVCVLAADSAQNGYGLDGSTVGATNANTSIVGGQLLFTVGMVMFLIYYGYYEQWAVFSTSTLSLLSILCMTGLKVYLEEIAPRSRRRKGSIGNNAGGGGGGCDSQSDNLGSALLGADQRDGPNARVGDDSNRG